MLIYVTGIEEKWERAVAHLIDLFFEDTTISFQALNEMPDLQINIEIHKGEPTQTKVALETQLGNRIEKEWLIEWNQDLSEEEQRKRIKRGLSQALLSLLQDYTGIEQPWGILTGVRPTKLMHSKLQMGIPMEEVHRELQEDYLVQPEKSRLLERIAERQLAAVPDLYELKHQVSIYIGIPFCPTKCAYCTFPAYAINGRQGSVDSFLGGLHYEMREVGNWLREQGIPITTVYFGGRHAYKYNGRRNGPLVRGDVPFFS